MEKDGVSQGCVENPDKKAEADRIAQDNERRKNLGLNRNQYKKYTAIEEELKNLEGLSGTN